MANYPVITASSNGKLIQYIDEQATSNNICVKHHINFNSDEDGRLGAIEVKDRAILGDQAFVSACQVYGVTPETTTTLLVIFHYDFITLDPARGYRIVRTFSEGSDPYVIPGKQKVVAADIGTSKTGGEAL